MYMHKSGHFTCIVAVLLQNGLEIIRVDFNPVQGKSDQCQAVFKEISVLLNGSHSA